MDIDIRTSQWADYPQIVAIENQIWNSTNTPQVTHYASPEEYAARFPVGSHLVAVSRTQEEVLGFIGFHPATSMAAHQWTWSIDIGVNPTVQSSGVGTKLVDAVKKQAQSEQIHKLSLRVLGTNQNAIRFYQKNGFVIEGTLKEEFWLNDQFVDDVFMGFTVKNETHLVQ